MTDEVLYSLFKTLTEIILDAELRLRGDIINCESQLRNEIRALRRDCNSNSVMKIAEKLDEMYDTDEFTKALL